MDLLDGWFQFDVGEGAFFAIFGLVFVVLGITLLVLILAGIGKIMSAINERRAKKAEIASLDETPAAPKAAGPAEQENGVSPEEIAAITAALMAYYTAEQTKCDFVVRRIKRL